jgi:hypothetical protein
VAHFVSSCGTFCAFQELQVKNCKSRIAKKSLFDSLDVFFSRLFMNERIFSLVFVLFFQDLLHPQCYIWWIVPLGSQIWGQIQMKRLKAKKVIRVKNHQKEKLPAKILLKKLKIPKVNMQCSPSICSLTFLPQNMSLELASRICFAI